MQPMATTPGRHGRKPMAALCKWRGLPLTDCSWTTDLGTKRLVQAFKTQGGPEQADPDRVLGSQPWRIPARSRQSRFSHMLPALPQRHEQASHRPCLTPSPNVLEASGQDLAHIVIAGYNEPLPAALAAIAASHPNIAAVQGFAVIYLVLLFLEDSLNPFARP